MNVEPGALLEADDSLADDSEPEADSRVASEAVAALAPLPEGPVKKALTRFADTIVERSS